MSIGKTPEPSMVVGETPGIDPAATPQQVLVNSSLLDSRNPGNRDVLIEMLRLANEPQGLDRLLERLVGFLVEYADCECIAVRLRDGEDFPYYHTRGFTPEFVALENSLCAMGPNGRPVLDEEGNPALECMCGHVLCGRFDLSRLYFTSRGSFWTNSTSKLVDSTTEDDRFLRNLRGRCVESFESVALIPMRSEDETYGMVHLTDTRRGRFTPEMISLLEEVASIAANVVARKQAEDALRETNSRSKLLSETTGELLTSDNPQQSVQRLCKQIMDALGCDVFFNYLVDENEGCLHLNACSGIPEETAKRIEWLDYGVAVCGCVAREGCPIVAEDIQHTQDVRTKLVKSFGIQAYACNPLLSQGGRVIGTLSFGTRSTVRFSPKDLSLMKTVADHVATAMERIRIYEREHNIAKTLQQAIIPPDPPSVMHGYRFAYRYLPALTEAEIGGDFYDVFDLGNEKIGVLIGDVVGKGLSAAMRVAAARYTVRGYAYQDPRPGRVLSLANNVLCKDRPPETGMLTAFFAVIDARLGTIVYANAGHEPPLVLDRNRTKKDLGMGNLPIGLLEGTDYTEGSRRLHPGERIVMFTDGITEARKPGPQLFGQKGLRDCLNRHLDSSIEEIADCILAAAHSHAGGKLQDDAAVVVFEQTESA